MEDKWQHCTVDFGSKGPFRYYSYCSNQQFINLFSYMAIYRGFNLADLFRSGSSIGAIPFKSFILQILLKIPVFDFIKMDYSQSPTSNGPLFGCGLN